MNFWGKLSGAVAENRPLSSLLLAAAVALGLFGFFKTPKQYDPEITLPAFQIQIPFPGATAREVREIVLRELEEKIAEIPGVDTISAVARDGVAIENVQFEVGENLEISKVKLFSKISENLDRRAGRIGQPIIKNITPDAVPILVFTFSSDAISANEIRRRVVEISHAVQTADGASDVEIFGGNPPALRILLNPEKLRTFHISAAEIQKAILKNISRNKIGFLENRDTARQIEIDAGVIDAESARKILIAPDLFLGDVAEVSDGFSENHQIETFWKKGFSDKKAVFLAVAKRKGENASSVAKNILKKFHEKIREFPELKVEITRNEAKKAENAIFGLGKNLMQSVAIVGAVLLLFLGFRAAMVVALAIPLTLFFVFFAGFLAGQTINRVTLFALILSLGLLVDSATVVVESLTRKFQKSGRADRAAIESSVGEIGTGLLLSTITSVIVFFPMKFISGMMGPYMGPIAFFVPAALIFSLLVAFFLTPFLAKIFFSPTEKRPLFDKFFRKIAKKYAHFLEKILRNKRLQKKILIAVFGGLFVVFLFPVFQIVKFQMLPKSDENDFLVTIDAPAGTNFEKTNAIARQISAEILKNPAVTSVQKFVGAPPILNFNALFRGFSGRKFRNLATLKVNLKNSEKSTEKIVAEIRQKVRKNFPELGNVRVRFIENPPGPPVRATLVAKIKSENPKTREIFARKMEKIFQKTAGVVDIDATDRPTAEKMVLAIDPEKSRKNGLTNENILAELFFAGGAKKIAEFWGKKATEHQFVEMEFEKKSRDDAADLKNIFVKNAAGKMIPLDAVIFKKMTPENPPIFVDERADTTFVTAEMSGRSVIYAVIDAIKSLFQNPPENFSIKNWNLFHLDFENPAGEKVRLEWGGEWKMTLENFRDLGLAMIVAFALLYGVLILQFRSFLIPPLILATIFLAFLGILPGFAILGYFWKIPLTATALIGFIALMGIVVNNAILFLEFVNILRDRGVEKITALVDAGAERLRPIVLTSLTTVFGSLTIAGDPIWSGLAWTIVFGLSLSTFLTLGIFPILYARLIK